MNSLVKWRRCSLNAVCLCVAFAQAGCRWLDNGPKGPFFKEQWRAVTGAAASGVPAVVGNRVIDAFDDRTVRAFDLGDGRELWKTVPFDQGLYPVTVLAGADSLVVVTGAHSVIGIASQTGMVRWSVDTPEDSSVGESTGAVAQASLALSPDRSLVAVPAWGSTVTAIRSADGVTMWSWRAQRDHGRRHGANGAVWCDGAIFVSLWRYVDERGLHSIHSIAKLNAVTGARQWEVDLPFDASVVSANGWMMCDDSNVWATTMGGPLWAIQLTDGAIAHRVERTRGYLNNSGPQLAGSLIFADGGITTDIIAFDSRSLARVWSVHLQSTPRLRMSGGQQYLWFSDGSYTHVYRASDGARLIFEKLDFLAMLWAPYLISERDAILPLENGLARVQLRLK